MSESLKNNTEDDKELDDLLDSALDDFDGPNQVVDKKASGDSSKTTAVVEDPELEQTWNEEFITSQAKLFEEKMAALFSGNPAEPIDPQQISLGFQRIAEAASLAVHSDAPAAVDSNFSQSINDALRSLSQGQDNLQSPFSPDDIAGMFGNIDLNESGENNAFLPFMQGMMQSLLSAEILLPSLKDLVDKYPKYLEENADKISAEDKERYTKQLNLMQEVCQELEKEKPDDSAEVKKERFNIVLDRMQKMQELGQPPSEIVGELGAGSLPTLDPTAFNDPSQCVLM